MNQNIIQIKFRFIDLPFIVCDVKGKIWQLPHCSNNRTKVLREIKQYINNGVIGYRINEKYYSRNKLNKLAYKSIENYIIPSEGECPF